MRIFVIILVLIFGFTSTASYAANCCFNQPSKAHDCCPEKNKVTQQEKKCAFECGLNFSAKTLNALPQIIVTSKAGRQFKTAHIYSYYEAEHKSQERPPKQSV